MSEQAGFEVARMARLLGVSCSGCCRWQARQAAGPGPQAVHQQALDQRVRAHHPASDGVYGAPRITADLHDEGCFVNVKTVAASMYRQGLKGTSPGTFTPVTTIPGIPAHRIADRVQQR